MKFSEFLTEESILQIKGAKILWRNPARAWQGEPMDLSVRGGHLVCVFLKVHTNGEIHYVKC
jgi:hypothetical protein